MPSLYIKNNVVGKCKILFQLFMLKQILNSLFLPQQTSVSTTASSSYSPSLFCGFPLLCNSCAKIFKGSNLLYRRSQLCSFTCGALSKYDFILPPSFPSLTGRLAVM
jgi:hypothetical protein